MGGVFVPPLVQTIEWLGNPWKAHVRRRGRLLLGVGISGWIIFVLAWLLTWFFSPTNHVAQALIIGGWVVGLTAGSVGLATSVGRSGDLRRLSRVPDRIGINSWGLRMDWTPPRTDRDRKSDPWLRESLPWEVVANVRVYPGLFGACHYVGFGLKDGGDYHLNKVSTDIALRIKREFDSRSETR
jgi:hypothetical protein